jgi:ubiquinone/menaquinone biosynthesis C-methylase UbiE
VELMMNTNSEEQQVREEFNRWAEAGRGAEMEKHHRPITDPTLEQMNLRPADTVLDIGCGTGWLARQIAIKVPEGRVVGIDISDEMIKQAQRSTDGLDNLTFLTGGVDLIPWQDDFFTRAISVESAYYWPDPARGVREIFRVLRPGGSAWILINFYRDNPYSHQWVDELTVPVKLLSAEEWASLFRETGFSEAAHRRIPDRSPTPEVYSGRWFRNAEQLRRFKEEGALLVYGVK